MIIRKEQFNWAECRRAPRPYFIAQEGSLENRIIGRFSGTAPDLYLQPAAAARAEVGSFGGPVPYGDERAVPLKGMGGSRILPAGLSGAF